MSSIPDPASSTSSQPNPARRGVHLSTFNVAGVAWGCMDGIGPLSCVPHVRLEVRARPSAKTLPVSAPGLGQWLNEALPEIARRPRWCLLAGDEQAFDSAAISAIQYSCGMRVAAVYSGKRPMVATPTLSIVRTESLSPGSLSPGLLFHSLVLRGRVNIGHLLAWNAHMSKHQDTHECYVEVDPLDPMQFDEATEAVASAGGRWRVTSPHMTYRPRLTPPGEKYVYRY